MRNKRRVCRAEGQSLPAMMNMKKNAGPARPVARNTRERDRASERRREGPARDNAGAGAVAAVSEETGRALADRPSLPGTILGDKRDLRGGKGVGIPKSIGESIAADAGNVGGFAERFRNRPGESDFKRARVFVQFVTVEGERGFQPEGVARAETRGRGAEVCEAVGEGFGGGGGDGDFKSVFAGVSAARDADRNPRAVKTDLSLRGPHEVKTAGVGRELREDAGGVGTLKGEEGFGSVEVSDGDIAGFAGDSLDDLSVVLFAGGVEDEDEFVIGEAGEDEVVRGFAFGGEDETVSERVSGNGAGDEGEEFCEELRGVFAFDPGLSHVGDIEEGGVFAGGVVFLDDAVPVLDGEQVSGEGDDSGVMLFVKVVEGGHGRGLWRR